MKKTKRLLCGLLAAALLAGPGSQAILAAAPQQRSAAQSTPSEGAWSMIMMLYAQAQTIDPNTLTPESWMVYQKMMASINSLTPDMPEETLLASAESIRLALDSLEFQQQGGVELVIPDGTVEIASSEYAWREDIASVVLPDSVVKIGDNAFAGCSSLKKVVAGAGLQQIGYAAFSYCSSLAEFELPASLQIIGGSAFNGCSSLQTVTLPDGLKSLGDNAFEGAGLTGVSLPGELKSIANAVFRNCKSLGWASLPAGLESIGSNAFDGCSALTAVDLPAGLASIGSYAFAYSGLTAAALPDSVKTVEYAAFSGCASLESAALSGSMASVEQNLFSDCALLREVSLPDAVETIHTSAFDGCSSLTQVSIGKGLRQIWDDSRGNSGLFGSCSALERFVVDPANPTYSSDAAGALYRTADAALLRCPTAAAGAFSVGAGTQAVGPYAFAGCAGLTSVSLPASVTSIGNYSFGNCASLASAALPADSALTDIGSYAFYNCVKLGAFSFPEGLTSIGSRAFEACNSLASVSLPASLNRFGSAFLGCGGLEEVQLAPGIAQVDSSAFENCSKLQKVALPDGLTAVDSSAFSNCGVLEQIALPDGLASIGDNAFNSCARLAQLELPQSLTEIGYQAFSYCSSLEQISLPDGFSRLGSYAFSGCSGLLEVSLPDSLSQIGSYAFTHCPSLEKATLPSGITVIPYSMFYGCVSLSDLTLPEGVSQIEDNAFFDCPKLSFPSLPAGLTSIGNSAFSSTALRAAILPPSLQFLGAYAFSNCASLEAASIPAGISQISYGTFENCAALREISLPNSVNAIRSTAFSGCFQLQKAVIPNAGASIDANAFDRCDSLTLYGLSGSTAERFAGEHGVPFVSIGQTPPPEVKIVSAEFVRASGARMALDATGEVPEGMAFDRVVAEYSYDGVSYTAFQEIANPSSRRFQFYFEIENPQHDSLFLRITAYNEGDAGPSAVSQLPLDTTLPDAPFGLTAEANDSGIHLSWQYGVAPDDFWGYRVYRSDSPDGPFEPVFSQYAGDYYDTDVEDGASYYYYLVALDHWGHESAPTETVEASFTDALPPSINWIYPESGATLTEPTEFSFGVQDNRGLARMEISCRPEGGGEAAVIGSLELSGTYATPRWQWDTSSLSPGRYELLFKAVDQAGLSSQTAANYTFNNTGLDFPVLSVEPSDESICLSWTPAGEQGSVLYTVYCWEQGRDFDKHACGSTIDTQLIISPMPGDYFYRVTASNDAGKTVSSQDVFYSHQPGLPEVEIERAEISTLDHLRKGLTLTARVQGDDPFDRIVAEYSYDGVNYATFGESSYSNLSCSLELPAPIHDTLYLRVSARRGALSGPPAETALALDVTVPETPEAFAAEADDSFIRLTWDDSSLAEDFAEFHLYRSLFPDHGFAQIAASQTAGYADADVEDGQTYYYYVTALDEWGHESAPTETASAAYRDALPPSVNRVGPEGTGVRYKTLPLSYSVQDNYALASLALSYRLQGDAEFTDLTTIPLSGTYAASSYDWDISSLPTGLYEVRWIASDRTGHSSEPVTAVFDVEQYQPMRPPVLEAASGYDRVSLSWSPACSERVLQHYTVYRWAEGEQERENNLGWVQGTSLADSPEAGNYYYQVIAENILGESSQSEPVLVSYHTGEEKGPEAVIERAYLQGDYISKSAVLEVKIKDAIEHDRVTAEYSYDGINYFDLPLIHTGPFTFILKLPPPTHEMLYLRATAWRGEISGTPVLAVLPLETSVPKPASEFTAVAVDSYIHLMWNCPEPPAEFGTFRIYRSQFPDHGFAELSSIESLGYFDTSVSNGKTYYYYVTVLDGWGHESQPTPVVSAQYRDELAPTINQVLPDEGEVCYRCIPLHIAVQDNHDLASLSLSYRPQGGGAFTDLTTINLTGTYQTPIYNWDVSSLPTGMYEVRLSATDRAGLSSGPFTVVYGVEGIEEMAPVTPEAQSSYQQISLTWEPACSDRLLGEYLVYRWTEGTQPKLIGKTRSNSYADSVRLASYFYRVDAVNRFGETVEGQPVFASPYGADTEPPVAVTLLQNIATYPGAPVIFDGSGSSDNDEILSYRWDFGDGSVAVEEAVAEHAYQHEGSYVATLTVTDLSGNLARATIPVSVTQPDAASGKRAVNITVADEDTGQPVADAQVILAKPGAAEDEMTVLRTDSAGTVSVILDAEQVYNLAALKEGSEYLVDDAKLETGPASDGAQPQQASIRLSRAHFLVGEVASKELTAEEIRAAGIDTNDPLNQHCYSFTLTLEYTPVKGERYTIPVTYYTDMNYGMLGYWYAGEWTGPGGRPGGGGPGASGGSIYTKRGYPQVAGVGQDSKGKRYLIILSGRVSWLKQMFEVSLLVTNTSEEDWVEDCTATIDLPKGLSLAKQQREDTIGRIEPGGSAKSTWYVRGDAAGSYDIGVDVRGTYYPEPAEPFQLRFETAEPLEVADTSACLALHVGNVPRKVVTGGTYPIDFTLSNTADVTLNFITLAVHGGGNSQEFNIETLPPGGSKTFHYDIHVTFTADEPDVIYFALSNMIFVCSSAVPMTISFAPEGPDEPHKEGKLEPKLSFYDGPGEAELERLTRTDGSFSYDKADPDDTDFDCIELRSEVENHATGDGGGETARDVTVRLTAPEGFSFKEFELESEYEYSIDSIEAGAASEAKAIPLYPIYLDNEIPLDELSFEQEARCATHESVNEPAMLPVEGNPDEGRVPFRSTQAISAPGRTTSQEHTAWSLTPFAGSSYQYDHGTALLSLALSSAVYYYEDIRDALLHLGFSNIKGYNFSDRDNRKYQYTTDQDSVAHVFATKKLLIDGKVFTLVAVVVRGTVENEWFGNFNIGTSLEHYSFSRSARNVSANFIQYTDSLGIQKEGTKLLVTGHSRGAAAANLFTAQMDLTQSYASRENIFAYTFATPNVTIDGNVHAQMYNNIFNIVNDDDFVPRVPITQWGFDKYGSTKFLPPFGSISHMRRFEEVKRNLFGYTGSAFTDDDWWDAGKAANGGKYLLPLILQITAKDTNEYENKHLSDNEIKKLYAVFQNKSSPFYSVAAGAKLDQTRMTKRFLTPHDGGDAVAQYTLTTPPEQQRGGSFAHSVEMYLSWLHAMIPNEYAPSAQPSGSKQRLVTVNCPVDLEVYDSENRLVGRVTGDLPDTSIENGVQIRVTGSSKAISLPEGQSYTIKITGNGEGKMTYTVAEYGEQGRERQLGFYELPVSPDGTYLAHIGPESGALAASYALTSPDGNQIQPMDDLTGGDLFATSAQPATSGQGEVLGTGGFAKGDYVTLSALPLSGYEFDGWYLDGTKVSDQSEYSFVLLENAVPEARFVSPLTAPQPSPAVYRPGLTLTEIALPERWSWVDSTQQPAMGKSLAFAAYTPADAEEIQRCRALTGWDEETGSVRVLLDITVGKAEVPTPQLGPIVYNPARTLADVALPDGWAWENPDAVPTPGNGGYAASYTPADPEHYLSRAATLALQVNKAPGSLVIRCASVAAGCDPAPAVTASTGGSVSYRYFADEAGAPGREVSLPLGQGSYWVVGSLPETPYYLAADSAPVPFEVTADAPGDADKFILERVVRYAELQAASPSFAQVIELVQRSFTQTLADAQQCLRNGAASQTEVDRMWMTLMKEIHKLGFIQGDKDALSLLVETAEGYKLENYVEAGRQPLLDALQAAKIALADGNAMQGEVDEAAQRLLDAMEALRLRADKTLLSEAFASACALELAGYSPESVGRLNSALRAAAELLADENASQQQIDDALAGLQAAISSLAPLRAQAGTATAPPATGEPLPTAALAVLLPAALLLTRRRRGRA